MIIKVENATKKFGKLTVFEDINATFESGKIYLIKGKNGSGKTVFLKTLCGFYVLDNGSILQDEKKIRNRNNYISDAGIIIESPQFLSHLTLMENLKLLKSMSKKIDDEKIKKWINFYNLEKFTDTKYKHCSLGTKQKLALIQAFIHEPQVLLLDEPFNALDIESFKKTMEHLSNIKHNTIIVLSTHINDLENYQADEEYLFDNGKLINN